MQTKNTNTKSSIACDVKNCVHNSHESYCTASAINVRGRSADKVNETHCETFKCKSC